MGSSTTPVLTPRGHVGSRNKITRKRRRRLRFHNHQIVKATNAQARLAHVIIAALLPADLPQRAAIVNVTFAVVAFSVIIQSLTLKPMLRRVTPSA